MKSALLVVLLAAAASAAVVSNEVSDVVEVPDVDEVADVDMKEIPDVFVTDVDELTEAVEQTDEDEKPAQTAVDTRRSLSHGSIGSKDVRIHNAEYRASGIKGHYHVRDIRVSTTRWITAIQVSRVWSSQGATPSIIGGGIGKSTVTIRIRSAIDRGYYYRVQIYAR